MQLETRAWYYINVLIGDLIETPWCPGPRDPPMVRAGIFAESSSFICGMLDSRRDTFNKEIKEGGPVTRCTGIEARSPKVRSQDSHNQASCQENHLLFCKVPKGGSPLKLNYGHFLVFVL